MPSPLQVRRTHNTLLFQKLLNLRDGASPFTLLLDTLEQSAAPLIREFFTRAKISKSKIIYIFFATLRKEIQFDIDVFISARGKPLSTLSKEITSHLTPTNPPQKTLLLIDSLNPLSLSVTTLPQLPTFLSTLLLSPSISLLATYHTDIPISSPQSQTSLYLPPPLTTLTYLATAILRVKNLSHLLAQKRATSRSLEPPVFGLAEYREGVVFSLRSSSSQSPAMTSSPAPMQQQKGNRKEVEVVVEMEMRRKSGRGIVENFVLSTSPITTTNQAQSQEAVTSKIGKITILDDHPAFSALLAPPVEGGVGKDEGMEDVTFKLGLSEKEKKDREGIVLPYFDAQKRDGGGVSEGGRILYEMGKEDWDDFDEEEDEIR